MKLVKRNQKLHNPDSPLLIGEVKESDVVNEVNEPSYIDTQTRLLILINQVFHKVAVSKYLLLIKFKLIII